MILDSVSLLYKAHYQPCTYIAQSLYVINDIRLLQGGGGGGGLVGRGVAAPSPEGYRNRGGFPAGLSADNCPNYPYCYWRP